MAPIASYVFLDLETTGLPVEECNKTKITELSLIAVKRSHILETKPGHSPRVQHKLTLCLNPRKLVHPTSTVITGLSNDLLEHESPFNLAVFDTINNFLSLLSKPVCLIAQNGLNYDYPILKKHLVDLGVSFPDDLMCADCLHAFFDILTAEQRNFSSEINVSEGKEGVDEVDLMYPIDPLDMQKQNETTPRKRIFSTDVLKTPRKSQSSNPNSISKVRRTLFWGEGPKPRDSYKLKNIYERLFRRPAIIAHRAENDCIMAVECAVSRSQEFVKWVDENRHPFSEVKPMTIGVKLGQ